MKKKVLFIGTGGTIASEMSAAGLLPGLSAERLLSSIPEIRALCDINALQLFDLDSTEIGPSHWLDIAKTVRENYDGFDGFVISHGTDTVAYTAAALSYLIQGSPKPIVLTGAQKPIGFDSTDSRVNLSDSFLCACSESLHGVFVVFSGRVIGGTRARKTRTKSFDAFSSINYPCIAHVRDGAVTQYIVPEHYESPRFFEELETRAAVLRLSPGMDAEILSFALSRCDALVIESFGVGGLPHSGTIHETARRAAEEGKIIIMASQVQDEGSDLAVYSTGRALSQNPRVLEVCDMTTEAALTKIMWILGQTRDSEQIRRLFYTPVSHDILNIR